MKKYFIILVSMITLSFNTLAFANTNSTLALNKYYHATCKAITGTWQGFSTDQNDLFGNGGPWPTTVSLFYQNGRVIGQADNIPPSRKTKIWAQCNKGTLHNIFMGKRGQCGEYSQGGELVSKNVLVLSLHYESAMTGTNFLVFLKRVNNSYPYSIPTNRVAFKPGVVRTCH